MRKVIAVFAKEIDKAREKATEVAKSIKEDEKYTIYAHIGSLSTRSLRAHELYIDNELESEVIDLVLLPHLVPYDRNDTDYNWKEHVHYF
ncbi:hypothetical protein [Paenibacillus lactis]|uniref:hypothetical protein n=1 Tax=Paenibacillus lactis TaxID=228574 RepID=UPI003D75113D